MATSYDFNTPDYIGSQIDKPRRVVAPTYTKKQVVYDAAVDGVEDGVVYAIWPLRQWLILVALSIVFTVILIGVAVLTKKKQQETQTPTTTTKGPDVVVYEKAGCGCTTKTTYVQ